MNERSDVNPMQSVVQSRTDRVADESGVQSADSVCKSRIPSRKIVNAATVAAVVIGLLIVSVACTFGAEYCKTIDAWWASAAGSWFAIITVVSGIASIIVAAVIPTCWNEW